MSRVALCHASELPEGSARGFARWRVFLLRREGRAHAWRDACPHHGFTTPLAWRQDAYLNAAGTRIVCAAHGAQFEPDTGLCVLGPCLGDSLTPVPLHLGPQGHLEIDTDLLQEIPS